MLFSKLHVIISAHSIDFHEILTSRHGFWFRFGFFQSVASATCGIYRIWYHSTTLRTLELNDGYANSPPLLVLAIYSVILNFDCRDTLAGQSCSLARDFAEYHHHESHCWSRLVVQAGCPARLRRK